MFPFKENGWYLRPGASLFILPFFLALVGCGSPTDERTAPPTNAPKSGAAFRLQPLGTHPHRPDFFTQGLFFWQGRLYESIGLRGRSAFIKYAPDHQRIQIMRRLDDAHFGEGAAQLGGILYQLTWQAGQALAWRGPMLSPAEGFRYRGEGWGLTADGSGLWMSNGSAKLTYRDTKGTVHRTITARWQGKPLDRLNELEWINGWLFANRWQDTRIYIIDPKNGMVHAALNLAEFARPHLQKSRDNVLNGIAWNPATEELWITGKNWDQFYRFKLTMPAKNPPPTADNATAENAP